MKKLLSTLLLLSMLTLVVACGSTPAKTSDANNTTGTKTTLDLKGDWKQSNSTVDSLHQIATIDNNSMEIHWIGIDGVKSLYWAGTYKSPTTETGEYSWESTNDKSRTKTAVLASTSDSKTFTYKNGVISYSVTAMGTTKTVELKRSSEVSSKGDTVAKPKDLKSLELKETAYYIPEGSKNLVVAFTLKNPNKEKGVLFPRVRITAKDEKGSILGTQEFIGGDLMPEATWYSVSPGPKMDSKPAKVDFEVIEPSEIEWVSPDMIKNGGKPLIVENQVKKDSKIVGEIKNPNDFDIEIASVVVFFRDKNGKLLGGESKYIDKIPAKGKIPFDIAFFLSDESIITDNFEVFAFPG